MGPFGACLNPVMTQVGLGLGVAGAMDRSITTTGARIRVIGAIRVRDTVKIRVKINVNSAQNVIFASLYGSDPPPPVFPLRYPHIPALYTVV